MISHETNSWEGFQKVLRVVRVEAEGLGLVEGLRKLSTSLGFLDKFLVKTLWK